MPLTVAGPIYFHCKVKGKYISLQVKGVKQLKSAQRLLDFIVTFGSLSSEEAVLMSLFNNNEKSKPYGCFVGPNCHLPVLKLYTGFRLIIVYYL